MGALSHRYFPHLHQRTGRFHEAAKKLRWNIPIFKKDSLHIKCGINKS